ncbi:alkaline protease 1 [Trichoderma asperellum]|uniref:Alkaline protease 1 n=1 Tax=Trichoderma asperellum TaxID=101201 RepID=A0A6V8QUL4_TRIAP|nr:alkaline protease 1 [Trichoderma asperellum]
MAWFKQLALFLITALPRIAALPVNDANDNSISAEGRYIVTLQNNIPPSEFRSHMSRVAAIQYRNSGNHKPHVGIERTYAIGEFQAYSGAFDGDTLKMIRNDTRVAEIEPDAVFTLHDKASSQFNAPWGLATLSSKRRNTATYHYDKSAGNGTFAYVVDSGINTKHLEFEGRASNGYNAVDGDFTDLNGHGTHCAGIIGSKSFGVAKQTELIAVKVFLNRETLISNVLDGFQWAVHDIRTKGRQSRAVVNMSFGGNFSRAVNHAVESAFEMGVFTVVAAGNDQKPARDVSPASAPNAFTVGAIDADWHEWEHSNFGPEINIFAPGVEIESTFISTEMATRKLSGTSMAAPHVTGLALYLLALEDLKTPTMLRERILGLGTRNRIHNLKDESPNLIAHNGLH